MADPNDRWRQPDPARSGWWALALLPLLIGVALHPRGVRVEVDRKLWQREIDIEAQVQEMFSEPCERMPAGAHLQEQRVHEGQAFCRFVAPAWRKGRMAVAEGEAPLPPAWPVLVLDPGERPGARRAWQALQLRDEDGRTWRCRLPLADWGDWPLGARTRLDVHRFSGVADCASLPPPPKR